MAATVIESNHTPLSRVDVDPVDLDIIENALRNARHEMDAVLFRIAMSPGIREQHDEFPLIANRDGKMVVGQFGAFINVFLNSYEGEIHEGDVFLTNDPYSCDGAISHTPDWLVLLPIFKKGRVIGWAAMFGHMTDTGGRVPGSMPTDAQQIYEEGIHNSADQDLPAGRASGRDSAAHPAQLPHAALEPERSGCADRRLSARGDTGHRTL